MIVKCISTNWSIRRMKFNHVIWYLLGWLRLPEKGKEYYVIGYFCTLDATYYHLEGYGIDIAFNSKHFTYSESNIVVQDMIEESLMI